MLEKFSHIGLEKNFNSGSNKKNWSRRKFFKLENYYKKFIVVEHFLSWKISIKS